MLSWQKDKDFPLFLSNYDSNKILLRKNDFMGVLKIIFFSLFHFIIIMCWNNKNVLENYWKFSLLTNAF